jgi:hypothetical protein
LGFWEQILYCLQQIKNCNKSFEINSSYKANLLESNRDINVASRSIIWTNRLKMSLIQLNFSDKKLCSAEISSRIFDDWNSCLKKIKEEDCYFLEYCREIILLWLFPINHGFEFHEFLIRGLQHIKKLNQFWWKILENYALSIDQKFWQNSPRDQKKDLEYYQNKTKFHLF